MVKSPKHICQICHKKVDNILAHYALFHDISTPEEFNEKIRKEELKVQRQRDFHLYVSELYERKKRGEISAEEYRELQTQWEQRNPPIV